MEAFKYALGLLLCAGLASLVILQAKQLSEVAADISRCKVMAPINKCTMVRATGNGINVECVRVPKLRNVALEFVGTRFEAIESVQISK